MRPRRGRLLVGILTLLIALASVAPALAAWPLAPARPVHGIDPRDMDLSVDPGEDFYGFANGGWLDRTEIPADRGAYGVFDELDELTTEQLLSLLDELATAGGLEEGSDQWKAVQLFALGMDVGTRDTQGVEPIQPLLDEIAAISDLDDLHTYQQEAVFSYITGLLQLAVFPDLADSSVNAVYLVGPYFGLPDRDYYLEEDPGFEPIREAYVLAAAEMLVHAGYDPGEAEAAAQAVYDFEHDLVEPTLTREEQQDISLFYNPRTLAELRTIYPMMDWDGWAAALGLTGVEQIIVTELRYLESLTAIVEATPVQVIKDYLVLELMWSLATFLSEEVGQTNFEFNGQVLQGLEERAPLNERVLNQINGLVGEAVGQVYVSRYFPPEAKEQITALVEAIIVAFRQRLEAITWMTEETRAIALQKLDNLRVKVGYPDRWRSYENVEVTDSYVTSALSAFNADYQRTLDQYGQPVDRDEWGALPQEINAYYDLLNNDITFPAGILQPPFFDYLADPASNFGAIGFVIGHEITHGFDLQGAQFDPDGNLANWWTEEDNAAFQELNDRVVAQYGAIEVLPGLFIDGQYTVTENVADLGGVQVAFDGLQTYLAEQGDPGLIDGFTQEQRFFIAAATVWREKIRDEYLTTLVQTDVHAPASARATVPLQNMDEFYAAFDIEPGDPMYLPPEERIVIW